MSETTIYNITRKFTNTEIDMADVESANVAFQSEFTGIQATPKYSVAKNGTDVVATLPGVTYYATVDINEDFIADGHLEQVANGVWNSSNPKNYSLGYGKQSIIDALESGTWKKGDVTVDIAGYKALEDKTGWVFQGGTLKLTIETHKSHHASYDSYYFTTKTLYNLEAALTETDTSGIEHHEFTDVHMLLDVADLTAVYNGTYTGANWYGAAWEAAQTNYGSNLALSNLHIWEVIGETETDITTQYLDKAADHTGFDTESDYNDALAGATNDQTLTFANFVDNNNLSVNDSKYLVDLTKEGTTSYKGTIMNEEVTSTNANETFEMGRGQDTIHLAGYTGVDTVKLTGKDNDTLTLDYKATATTEAPNNVKLVGNDIKITTQSKVRYIMTAEVSGINGATPSLDTHKITDDNLTEINGKKVLVFCPGQASMIGTENPPFQVGDYVFATSKSIYYSEKDSTGVDIMFGLGSVKEGLSGGTVEFDAARYSNFKVYEIAATSYKDDYKNPVIIKEITKDYKKIVDAIKDDPAGEGAKTAVQKFSELQQDLWEQSRDSAGRRKYEESTLTIKDFGKDSTVQSVLFGDTDLATQTYEVEMGKDKKGKTLTTFTGTRLNESIESQAANETFQMGTATKDEYRNGEDTIYFYDKYGNDAVKVVNGATLDLIFADPTGLTYSAKGNDLKITDNTLEYYALVDVDQRYLTDGKNDHVKNGQYGNDDEHYDPKDGTDISDKLINARYVLKSNPKTSISVEKFDSLSAEKQALYQFKGTLKLTLRTNALHSTTYYDKTLFTSDTLYQLLEEVPLTGDPVGNRNVAIALEAKELAQANAGGQQWHNQATLEAQGRADKQLTFTNARVYQVENGKTTEITDAYIANATKEGVDESDYNAALAATQDFNGGTVTIKDFSNAARTADDIRINGTQKALFRRNINGTIVYTDPQVAKLFTTTDADVKGGKITIKGNTNNTIDVSNYSSDSAKGVKITTGKGNDYITGSMYNDTITSKGGYNNVVEKGGTNKITLGNGGSTVTVTDYSSNTIKAKGGKNFLDIDSLGTNKVTLGKGDDTVWLQDGVNTVNVGAGENHIWATDGNNKITGGKNKDVLTVNAGQTTAKLGAGNDIADINGGNVVLDMGAGNDNVYFDNHGIVGVGDIIASVNGGKGNDLYDLSQVTFTKHDEDAGTFANRIAITDKNGTNTVVLTDSGETGLADDYDVYFNVSIKTKRGKITKKTVGKSLLFNKDGDIASKDTGVVYNYDGKLTKAGVTKNLLVTADAETAGKGLNINQIASTVATWLNANGYQSADAVMYGSDDTARAQLAGIYQGADTVYMKDGVTEFTGYTAANVF